MRNFTLLLPAACALILTGCDIDLDGFRDDRFQKDFRFTYPLSPNSGVTLENMNGNVDIAGWDRNEIEITGVKYARSEALRDETKIDIQHSDRSVNIRTIAPSAMNGGVGARYVIRVPRQVTLTRITTSNARVHVTDIEGAVNTKTSNGAIQLSKLTGNAEAQTSNGSIEANDITGSAHLHTSNSSITAEGIKGPIDATSSNGSITIDLSAGPNEVQARTSNSSITARIPVNAAVRIRATTSNGRIDSAFENDHVDRHHMESILNNASDASPLVSLTTSNGHISIEKL